MRIKLDQLKTLITEHLEQEFKKSVKFTGILKLMPSDSVVAQAQEITKTLPKKTIVINDDGSESKVPVAPLHPANLHVTLAHQSILKPFKKQLKALYKAGQLPTPPDVQLDPAWEQRDDPILRRRSWVAWVLNENEIKAYLNEVMSEVGGPENAWDIEVPTRRFHVSLANLTGNPGDSVR